MDNRLIDLTGKKFERLYVIERTTCPIVHGSKSYKEQTWWKCRCDCGAITVRNGQNIRAGRVKSCGCMHIENGHKAALRWQKQRAITPEKRAAILRFLEVGASAEKIAAQMHITPSRIVEIRREVRS